MIAPPSQLCSKAFHINLTTENGLSIFKTSIEKFHQEVISETCNLKEILRDLSAKITDKKTDPNEKKQAHFLLRLCSTGVEIYSEYKEKDILGNETIQGQHHTRLWYDLENKKLVVCDSLKMPDKEVLNEMEPTDQDLNWIGYSGSLAGTDSLKHTVRVAKC